MSELIVNNELIEKVVVDYSDMLFRLSYQRLHNREAAEDIVQETFLKFIKASSFKSDEHMKAWLIRVTINLCLDYFKSPKNKNLPLDDNRTYSMDDELDIFRDMKDIISDNEKDAIYLFYYEGYQAKEIAKILKKSENAIYLILNKARNKLKNYFSEDKYE